MGVSADDYVIVCVGMIRPDKGQDHLIGALGLMKQQGLTPDWSSSAAPPPRRWTMNAA